MKLRTATSLESEPVEAQPAQLLPYLRYFVLLSQRSQQNVPQNLEATGLCIHVLWSGELERVRLKDLLEGREGRRKEKREWAAQWTHS